VCRFDKGCIEVRPGNDARSVGVPHQDVHEKVSCAPSDFHSPKTRIVSPFAQAQTGGKSPSTTEFLTFHPTSQKGSASKRKRFVGSAT
jgi:hypothetical protein